MPLSDRRPGGPTGQAGPPEIILQLQHTIETLYLSNKALQQDVKVLRTTQPVLCTRRARPSLPTRILLKLSRRFRRRYQANVIRRSGLFDPDWYLKTYADVATAGADPLRHFLDHGARDHRNPGPHFDTAHYLHLYPDIVATGLNPLLHYLSDGWDEGRSIRPGMPHAGT